MAMNVEQWWKALEEVVWGLGRNVTSSSMTGSESIPAGSTTKTCLLVLRLGKACP